MNHKQNAKLFLPSKEKLDQIVLDIEFLLISVVQGVALAALASSAVLPISNGQFEYWLYIASAFLLVLIFWSQAIIHTLSFIDWPIDLTHNFFYFLVSFIEVMAFYHVTSPLKWFEFMIAFFVVAGILYAFDFKLINQHEKKYTGNAALNNLYTHICTRQRFELKTWITSGLLYNLLSVFLIRTYPYIFIEKQFHVILITIEVLFIAGVLISSLRSFKKRILLITSVASE